MFGRVRVADGRAEDVKAFARARPRWIKTSTAEPALEDEPGEEVDSTDGPPSTFVDAPDWRAFRSKM